MGYDIYVCVQSSLSPELNRSLMGRTRSYLYFLLLREKSYSTLFTSAVYSGIFFSGFGYSQWVKSTPFVSCQILLN